MIKNGNIIQKIATHPETHGWFLWHFIPEWDFFHSEDFELKYQSYKKWEKHIGSVTSNKRKTITILLEWKIRIIFPSAWKEYILTSSWDYIADNEIPWDHEVEVLEDSTILAIRTPSKPI